MPKGDVITIDEKESVISEENGTTGQNESEKVGASSTEAELSTDEAEAQTAEHTEQEGETPKAKDPAVAKTGEASPRSEGRQISVSVRSLLIGVLIVGWAVTAGVLTWLYLGEKTQVQADEQRRADYGHAEQVAMDYAVKAAKIDFNDLEGWKKNLVDNTTPDLRDKLTEAGKSMEQLLVPLQWNSTATPLVAKVRSADKGVFVVDTFVGVNTKTMQAPEGLQSTATYSVTVDSNHAWQISDVGGIGSVVGQK